MLPLAGPIAGLLALAGLVPYVISILKRETVPNRASYGIWAVVDLVNVISYIGMGARTTFWTGLAFTFTAILIFVLSLKYGMGGFNRLDIACAALALVAILLWVVTRSAAVAFGTSFFAATLGYLPTFKKAYLIPHTENRLSWAMGASAATLNLLALSALTPKLALMPISYALFDVSITLLICFPALRVNGKRARTYLDQRIAVAA